MRTHSLRLSPRERGLSDVLLGQSGRRTIAWRQPPVFTRAVGVSKYVDGAGVGFPRDGDMGRIAEEFPLIAYQPDRRDANGLRARRTD